MAVALAFIGAYAILTGVASFAEGPVGARLDAFRLNLAIRAGVLILGAAALLVLPGPNLPPPSSLAAAVGIGVIGGIGSVSYCYAVNQLPVWLVACLSNAYILVTVLLGVLVLHESVGLGALAGLILTIAGVLTLSIRSRGGVSAANEPRGRSRLLPYAVLAANVLLVGLATFLEKPALDHGLTAMQLNAFSAFGNVAVAAVALGLRREVPAGGLAAASGFGLGTLFGAAGIFYFLGLRDLPVAVAAPTANSYVVLTVLLSSLFLGQTLDWRRVAGIAVTLVGVAILAGSSP